MGSKEQDVLNWIELEASDKEIEALWLILCKKKYVEGITKLLGKEKFRKFANDIIWIDPKHFEE